MPSQEILQEIQEFDKLLKSKQREIAYPPHAKENATKRIIPQLIVGKDLLDNTPVRAVEQKSEYLNERKFDVYYKQIEGVYRRYILAINDQIRLITLMRITSNIQGLIAKRKRKLYGENKV